MTMEHLHSTNRHINKMNNNDSNNVDIVDVSQAKEKVRGE